MFPLFCKESNEIEVITVVNKINGNFNKIVAFFLNFFME